MSCRKPNKNPPSKPSDNSAYHKRIYLRQKSAQQISIKHSEFSASVSNFVNLWPSMAMAKGDFFMTNFRHTFERWTHDSPRLCGKTHFVCVCRRAANIGFGCVFFFMCSIVNPTAGFCMMKHILGNEMPTLSRRLFIVGIRVFHTQKWLIARLSTKNAFTCRPRSSAFIFLSQKKPSHCHLKFHD